MNNQQSPTLLITGATGGMGRACALLAAQRGYNLLLSDLNAEKLDALTEKCRVHGVEVTDISDSAAIQQFVASTKSDSLDGIIHTVGLSPQMANWEKVMLVDLIATVELLEALKSPALKAGGSAVCISSMSAHMIPPNPDLDALLAEPQTEDLLDKLAALPGQPVSNSGAAYAYAKKALIQYVTKNAMDWGADNKRLTSISPGLIDTDMGRLEEAAGEESHAAMRKLISLRRGGQPEDIAKAALFLVSDEASYITGCDLQVDGGFVGSFKNVPR